MNLPTAKHNNPTVPLSEGIVLYLLRMARADDSNVTTEESYPQSEQSSGVTIL